MFPQLEARLCFAKGFSWQHLHIMAKAGFKGVICERDPPSTTRGLMQGP